DFAGLSRRSEPAFSTRPRLATIETAIDDNPREPNLERPSLTIRIDVGEHLDEGVLHRLVRFRCIPEILVGDSEGATLMGFDESTELLSRLLQIAAAHQFPDLDRETRVRRERCRGYAASTHRPPRAALGDG